MPATLAAAPPSPPAAAPFAVPSLPAAPLHRWTLEEYERFIALGALTTADKVELLDGFLLDKMPANPPHDHAISQLNTHFVLRAADRWVTRIQSAVRLVGPSLPEPDVALLRPPPAAYAQRRPGPEDILLLIEVSESSLAIDRGEKLRAYARAGVVEYWIVNVAERQVEICRDPDPAAEGYGVTRVAHPGETLAPGAFPDAAFAVSELFG